MGVPLVSLIIRRLTVSSVATSKFNGVAAFQPQLGVVLAQHGHGWPPSSSSRLALAAFRPRGAVNSMRAHSTTA